MPPKRDYSTREQQQQQQDEDERRARAGVGLLLLVTFAIAAAALGFGLAAFISNRNDALPQIRALQSNPPSFGGGSTLEAWEGTIDTTAVAGSITSFSATETTAASFGGWSGSQFEWNASQEGVYLLLCSLESGSITTFSQGSVRLSIGFEDNVVEDNYHTPRHFTSSGSPQLVVATVVTVHADSENAFFNCGLSGSFVSNINIPGAAPGNYVRVVKLL